MYNAVILWNYTQARIGSLCLSCHNYTIIMGKVVCLVYLEVLLVGFLGYSVLKVDIYGEEKKKMGYFRFLD